MFMFWCCRSWVLRKLMTNLTWWLIYRALLRNSFADLQRWAIWFCRESCHTCEGVMSRTCTSLGSHVTGVCESRAYNHAHVKRICKDKPCETHKMEYTDKPFDPSKDSLVWPIKSHLFPTKRCESFLSNQHGLARWAFWWVFDPRYET